MRTIAGELFPESREECETWKPNVVRYMLARRVMVVARTRIEGTWRAYVDAVPGEKHAREEQEVLDTGAKMPEKLARVIFPCFDELPYAR